MESSTGWDKGTVHGGPERIFSQELVLAIRDQILLLIIGPLTVALAAYLLARHSPHEYRSTAFLRIDAGTAKSVEAFVTSPPVADQILAKFSVGGTSPETRAEFIAKHSRLISPQPVSPQPAGDPANGGLCRLDVDSNDPHDAQSIATTLIQTWLASTRPIGPTRESLGSEMERHKLAADANSKLIDGLTSLPESNSLSAEMVLSALISKRNEHMASVNALRDRLNGITTDIIVVPPHLPQDPLPSRAKTIALLYGLAAVPVFLALVVLGRYLAPGIFRHLSLARYLRRAG